MKEKKTYHWHWLEQEELYQIKDIQGKYLFYCSKQKPLLQVARLEIKEHHFPLAKVVTKENKILDDYVLCLYDFCEKKDEDMLKRFKNYLETHGVRYERWKSEEETRNNQYEPEFYEKLFEKYCIILQK